MKKQTKRIISILLCLCMVFLVSQPTVAAESNKYSKVIAFGDSYSDNGEAKRISTAIVKSDKKVKDAYIKPSDELYWKNRYSNGKTAVEVLADKLNVPINNYAVGGATSGQNNYSTWMDALGNTGVLGQIDRFEKSLKGKKADSKALYFIFASANDYFYYVDYNVSGKVEAVANESVDNIKMAVRRLVKLGAKKFMVVNSSDLSMVPYEIQMKRTKAASIFTNYVNKKLPTELKELKKIMNVSISIFDMTKVSKEIKNNPSKFGLSVLKVPCEVTYPEAKKAKEKPDSYYFWDEWHYTKAVHKIFGQKMYEQIK